MSIQNQPHRKQQENILTFFRYIRPVRQLKDNSRRGWGREYYDVSPVEGLTLKFTIDYNTRVVKTEYAICKTDLFNKRVGQYTIAKFPNRHFTFAYPDKGFDQFGIVGYFARALIRDEVESSAEVRRQDVKSILNFILEA